MVEIILAVIVAVLGSSGMWAFLENRKGKKDAKTQMLIGLGHDRVIYLGTKYLERGSITASEYENLVDYLYKPYEMLGGNGSAKKIVDEVKKLPITKDVKH